MDRLLSILLSALAVIIGIVVHESAHALAAYILGDSTARSRGRISLNPLAHIDPFGTVLLPLLMVLAGGPVFAYAKPVPVHLGNLKNPKRDELLVALAGPLSNILVALLAALVYGVLLSVVFVPGLSAGTLSLRFANGVASFLVTLMSVNLSLAFFNLIPLPPLDGSSILVMFLKGDALRTYYEIQRYSMPILIIVLYLLPNITGIDLVGWYFEFTVYPLMNGLLSLAYGLI